MFHVFGVEIEWSWGLGGFSVHKQWTYLKQLNLYHFVTFFFSRVVFSNIHINIEQMFYIDLS
jgi:hypothetical protein